jgi:hypothetical protein
MNPMHISDAADLYDPSIQKMFVKTAKNDKENYKKYYTVETGVEDYVRKDSSLSGLGEADFVEPENAVITAQSPVQGYDKSYTQEEVGVVLSFTKRMWKFGIKKRDMTKIVNELRNAVVRKRERLCAERLDNGWATSYTHTGNTANKTVATVGGDAVAFFSASHTREDGGTNWNNIVYDGTTYNMDADYDALKAAHKTSSLIKDPKGNLMEDLDLDTVVVAKGSTPYFKFMEILGAIKKGWKPVSSDRDGTGVPEFKMLVLPRLTNTNYWYMTDSKMVGSYEYGLQYLESQSPMLEGPNVIFKTGEIQYKNTLMFTIGHNDARSWVGSTGLNA